MEKRTKKIITISAVLIAIITAAIISTIAIQATPANRLKRQLRLAQKYLNELNCEQAVLAYQEAISIDPKCEQAYFAIADIYIKTNEEDKAVAILEQAQANIQTESLTAKLDEVRKQAAAAKEARGESGSTGQNNNQGTAPTQPRPTTQAQQTTAAPTQPQPTTEASTAAPTEAVTEAPTEAPTEAQPEPQMPASGIAPANAGDIITFGTYEQDNNTGNGAEPIEWLVLDNQGDRMLVISRYGLDCQPYNEADIGEVTWEICTLRSWLNSEFYNTAFNDSEKASIRTTTLSNPDSLYGGSGGNATNDNVFCLSIEEAKAYFGADDSKEHNSARATKPTAYAVARGATEFDGNCWWWLRSPGYLDDVARVIEDGYIYEGGLDIGYIYSAVRPALWIGL